MKNVSSKISKIRRSIGSSKYFSFIPNTYQQAAFLSRAPIVRLVGGNRSGKTAMIGFMARMLAEQKTQIRENPIKPNYEVMILSLDANLTRQVIYPMLESMIPPAWLEIQKHISEAWIRCPGKSNVHIVFKSAEAGREKVQGGSFDWIAIDEQLTDENIWSELKMRIMDTKGRITFHLTPLLGSNFVADIPADEFVLPTEANPILDKAEILALTEGMNEVEKAIRLYGKWCDLSGCKYLDSKDVAWIKAMLDEPVEVINLGRHLDLFLFEDDIYEDSTYVAGGDIASGSGGDYTTLKIGRLEYTGHVVECGYLRSNTTNIPETVDAFYAVAEAYDFPLMLIEATGIGISVVQGLNYKGYQNVARRRDANMQFITNDIGFKTTQHSREWALTEFKKGLQKHLHIIRDYVTSEEIKNYQWSSKKNRYDHVEGRNDDALWASMMLWLAAQQAELPRAPQDRRLVDITKLPLADQLKAAGKDITKYLGGPK